MSSKELVTPEGLRQDGRRIGELRNISLEINPIADTDGSCIFNLGNTKVLASVSGPNDHARTRDPTGAILSVDYTISPYASNDRRNPQSSNPLPGQISSNSCRELALIIQKTFSNAILLHKWPNAAILIQVTVLCDQGGVLAASINAVTAALMVAGVDMNDVITAAASCVYDRQPLLDPNQQEVSSLGGSTTLAVFNLKQVNSEPNSDIFFTQSGSVQQREKSYSSKKIATIHHTQRCHLDQVSISLECCIAAASIIHDKVKDAVRQHFITALEL